MKTRVLALTVSLAAGLWGCSSTRLFKAEPLAGFDKGNIRKVMVISMSRPDVRREVEDEFARQWRKRGADVSASLDVLPPNTPIDKSRIVPIAKAQGFDTVLVSRILRVQKLDSGPGGQEFEVGESSADAEVNQYFETVVASPQYADQYQMAAVKATVYNVASENKIWSAVAQVLVSKELPAHIKDYVRTILKSLYQ